MSSQKRVLSRFTNSCNFLIPLYNAVVKIDGPRQFRKLTPGNNTDIDSQKVTKPDHRDNLDDNRNEK